MFSRDIRQRVDGTVAQVMAVAADLDRIPDWASGLSSNAQVEFSIDIERGILDHDVTRPDGSVVHVRLRVEPRGTGSEIVFTLERLPGTTDEQWRADAEAVAADLQRLAELCEQHEG